MLLVKLRLRRRRKRNERHLPISMWEEEFIWPEDPQQEASPPHLRGLGMEADKLRSCLSWQCIQPAADSGYSWSSEDMSVVLKKKGGVGDKRDFSATLVVLNMTQTYSKLSTQRNACAMWEQSVWECMCFHYYMWTQEWCNSKLPQIDKTRLAMSG